MPKTLYLIDGHAHFFRAYHAIRPGTMSSPVTREPTNLTYGFSSMMIKLLRDYAPDYVAVVIDVSGDRESFRSEIFADYKANRPAAPEDLHQQVERCLQMLQTLHIPVVGEAGVEADDVIATLVRRLEREHGDDLRIRIISNDKDLTQLSSDRVEMFDIYNDKVVGPEEIFKTPGVRSEHVRDILALMGDNVDNIPGVPGIGPKTAAQLILQYGSVAGIYEHIEDIRGKRRENLEKSRELVEVSRRLVALREDCEVDFTLDQAGFTPAAIDVGAMQALFRELGFTRQQEDIARLAGAMRDERDQESQGTAQFHPPAAMPAAPQRSDGFADSLFAPVADIAAAPTDAGDYEAITTLDALDALIADIRAAGSFAFDTETDGLHAVSAKLCGISIAVAPRKAYYIPLCSPTPDAHLDSDTVLPRLRPIFEDAAIAKIGHNIKFDLIVLRRQGVSVRGITFDTMIASYVIDATRSGHSLDALSLAFLNHTCTPITHLIGTGRRQKGFDEVPLEHATPYAAEDADVALRLRDALEPELASLGLRTLFDDVEMPLVEVLAELEYNGIRVDPDELDRQREKLQREIEHLRRAINDQSPHPFNPDSPKQLAAALFNKPDHEPPGLGLRPLKRGKTGPSTDVEVLEKLAADPDIESPVPRLIVEYRQLTKLVNTYLVALKDAIFPETGRVHASFNQTVAATGRLSSSDPNLQNIPIRTEVGREIRRAFVAEPGSALITADYSQIELRLLAHLSGDEALIAAFHEGADIHRAVASQVFGIAPEDLTPQHRDTAKMINFGIVYGITPWGLARRLGGDVSKQDAAKIIDDYKARFSRINQFLNECIAHAIQFGYVETILSRRREIPQITSRNPQRRALGERMAINTVVQGSAADLIKVAMIDLYHRLPEAFPEAKMLLQIHDELVFECPRGQASALRDLVVERMEAAMDLVVPLKVDSAIGESWIDAK